VVSESPAVAPPEGGAPAATEPTDCRWLQLLQLEQNKSGLGKYKPWRSKMVPAGVVTCPATPKTLGSKNGVHAFFFGAVAFPSDSGEVKLFAGMRVGPGRDGLVIVCLYVPKPSPDHTIYCLLVTPGKGDFKSVLATDIKIHEECEQMPPLDVKDETLNPSLPSNKEQWLGFIRTEHKDLAMEPSQDHPLQPVGEAPGTPGPKDTSTGGGRGRTKRKRAQVRRFDPGHDEPAKATAVSGKGKGKGKGKDKGKDKGKGKGKTEDYGLLDMAEDSECTESDDEFSARKSKRGPQGPRGATGPKGERGATGPAGKDAAASDSSSFKNFLEIMKEANRHAEKMAEAYASAHAPAQVPAPHAAPMGVSSIFTPEGLEALKAMKDLFK